MPRPRSIDHCRDLPDSRAQGRCDHELIDVLIIATCTLPCGGTGFDDLAELGRAKQEWFKSFPPPIVDPALYGWFQGQVGLVCSHTVEGHGARSR